MPVSPRREQITPFADEAMRLLRETWANPTMLAEEMFAILQRGIPLQRTGPINVNLSYGNTGSGITITQNGDGPFMTFVDDAGQTVATIGNDGTFNGDIGNPPNESPPQSPTLLRIRPTIVWADPESITEGTALSSTQLNAVAIDPNSNMPIAGTFEYDPPSGTMLSAGDNQQLRVVFTPFNSLTYKRARAVVTIDVTPAGIVFKSQVGSSDSGGAERSLSFAVLEDELIVVFIAISDTGTSGITFDSISDTDGNTYTQIDTYIRETTVSGTRHLAFAAYYAIAGSSGTFDFKHTPSSACDDGVVIGIYSGVDPVSPLNSFSSNSASDPPGSASNPLSTGTVTASAGDLICASFMGSSIDSASLDADYEFRGAATTSLCDDTDAAGNNAVTIDDDDANKQYVAFGVSFNKA